MARAAIEHPHFKTTFRNRRLLSNLRGTKERAAGYRAHPVVVRVDPMTGIEPSPKPPVRIFVGTEPAQYRAERVFVWSILKVRNPARAYQIHLMKDLIGFDRSEWKTGFTNYRYAIPALCAGKGRAIYNDVDQIYLSDPAELFDMEMGGAGVLGINEKESSVMLLDCEKMAALWKLQETQHLHQHSHYRRLAQDVGLWGLMSGVWNARDSEFEPGKSKLLHFTTLHAQPWRPFPDELRYRPHEHAEVWSALERSADAAGFTVFTKEHPSERYGELLAMYSRMHAEGRPEAGRSGEETFAGISLTEHVRPIARLVQETGARTMLDFGAGKGSLYRDSPDHPAGSRYKLMDGWDGVLVTCFDPGYPPFAGAYEDAYDGVIATDVLEHIPEDDIGWVLDELFSHARSFVYVVAACDPAKKLLPDGTNAHCTVLPPAWWKGQITLAAQRHPGVRWMLCTQEYSYLGFEERRRLTRKGVRSRFFAGIGTSGLASDRKNGPSADGDRQLGHH